MPEMAVEFDIEARWPELFEGMSELDRRAVVQTLASGWHEGWVPNRPDVADLVDVTRGVIDEAEYNNRIRAAIAHDRAAGAGR
jgi:hypothetical protein